MCYHLWWIKMCISGSRTAAVYNRLQLFCVLTRDMYISFSTFVYFCGGDVAWSYGYHVGLAIKRPQVVLLVVLLPWQVFYACHMCFCHQAVKFGTGQGALTLGSWEGKRRSGIALAMRYTLCDLSTKILHTGSVALAGRWAVEHPASAYWRHGTLYLFSGVVGL